MPIGKNTEITIQFTIEDQDGEILNDIYEHTPYRFIYGEAPGRNYPGLEKGVAGLEPGDSKQFTVPASQAFGKRDKTLIQKVRSSELPKDGGTVGNLVRKLSDNGTSSEPYTVIGLLGDWVYLDQNHPWAGKDLHYTVRVISVEQNQDKTGKVKPLRK
ncbi:MAG: FKBP-type peptidyl-prolyl cis-trans isomerase [Desulfatibacillum sp.]|nr:FKBP-type peptidyl-prolyl cis-trans isomerase [Desulfatibacillum sp.]